MRFAFFVWVTNLLTHLFAIVDRYMIVHYSGMSPFEALDRICPECAQRQPNGWMMEEYCQGCGAENHGIVF